MTTRRALVTGGSRGLGRALATALIDQGWEVIADGRDARSLQQAQAELPGLRVCIGDVADPAHRSALADLAHDGVDLLILNAGTLGPTPLRPLAHITPAELRGVLEVNVVAQHALLLDLVPLLRPGGAVLAITSDAAAEHYETWGPYAASKIALEHLVGTWAAEVPALRWWSVDPGDLRTDLHQAAFPGDDITDRPLPETVAPVLVDLVERAPASGRYRTADLTAGATR